MFLINGHEKKYLDANDRSIQFGDGIFTTARILDGHVCLHHFHLQRLRESCAKLFIPFTQWDLLLEEMCALAAKNDLGVLKVIISRGIGGKGYSIKGCFQPNRILSVLPYPLHYKNWKHSGITLVLSQVRLGRNPMLAGIKHLNRLEQILISIDLQHSHAHEALVLDSEGIIIECCTANIFWRKGDNVFTPRLDQAGVNGVMRQFCLSQLVHSSFRIIEVHSSLQELWSADEVLICNSLMPILPVSSCRRKIWKSRDLYQFLAPLCEKAR